MCVLVKSEFPVLSPEGIHSWLPELPVQGFIPLELPVPWGPALCNLLSTIHMAPNQGGTRSLPKTFPCLALCCLLAGDASPPPRCWV